MSGAALLVAGLLALQGAPPASFHLRAGPADQTINRLAAQAGIDVVIAADVRGRRTPALSGRMTPEAALARLLGPIDLRAVRIGQGMYRIEAAPRRAPPPLPARAPEPPPVTTLSEVIVTAAPPVGLAGAGGRRALDADALARVQGVAATDALADLSATVDSTRQGAGRNKLFIRGLADSAMNGPLQATVGQYFGDLRLGYGSPDPDLALIDISRVEVFEGPQGTRFGAGSIGGVVRLRPQPPVLGDVSGRLMAGAAATAGGDQGGDLGLILNAPLGDQAAVRLVGYARREGGFLDHPAQGLRQADHVDTTGGRLTLRWTPGAWTVDLLGVAQRVSGGDSQTIPVSEYREQRHSRVLEPYASRLTLAGVVARRQAGPIRLVSATSLSRQQLDERFDATQRFDPVINVVDRRQTTTTLASELRLDADPVEGWTLSGGATLAVGETLVERRRLQLLSDTVLPEGVDLRRRFAEAALYGEAAFSPAPDLRVALGARLSAVRIDTDLRNLRIEGLTAEDRTGTTLRMTPSLSVRWDPTPALTAFGRLERAVRPAGIEEAGGAFKRYLGDRVTLFEAGVRSRDWRDDLSGEASIGWVDWRDVQADIVTPGGDLVTDNVGDGVIRFLSLKAAWRPNGSLDVSGSVFINNSRLTASRPSIIGGGRTDIPNVAPLGAQLSLSQDAGLVGGQPLRLGADFRYVGQSRLGVGPALDVPQGGYLRSELSARWGDERRALTLSIANPLDTTGIRYGIGSPYQLFEPHMIPVRPLTVRLALDAAF